MMLLFDIGKNGNLAGHPTHPLKKFYDRSGGAVRMDGVKASLHFTKLYKMKVWIQKCQEQK